MWPVRLTLAKLRPWNTATILRTAIVSAVLIAFLAGDYALFRRLFEQITIVSRTAETPLFALGILRNLLGLVFLTSTVILFSSSLTAAIGAFFTDLDLDVLHGAPRSKLRIALARWAKTLLQAATIVYLFLIPILIAFADEHQKGAAFFVSILFNLALLLTIPVSLSSMLIVLLVRWFPVRRVHQIVATLAAIVLTVIVIGFRMSRPERFFFEPASDDVGTVLRAIELPSIEGIATTQLARMMTTEPTPMLAPQIVVLASIAFALFVLVAWRWYFVAYVRARESMAPTALGAASTTRVFDRLIARADPQLRAMLGKEVRTVSRDVAQWSQVFLMAALLFIYLYNIRMLPLGGDARATLVAYANLGMAGFVIAAICLRFAYPSVSAEGKAFWLVQTAPVSYRRFLHVKVFVYAAPLTLLALLLTAFANVILGANAVVWAFTMFGASLLAVTLVSLGVGLGSLTPNFNAENPLQVGLSLGGFAYMALSMAYVATVMVLMARPLMRYFLANVMGVAERNSIASVVIPIVIALTLSAALAVIPIRAAEKRLSRISESE